jgi:hypothetical protein
MATGVAGVLFTAFVKRCWSVPILYEAASLKHLLPYRFPNGVGRPLTRPRQRARLNRPVRKTGRNLSSRRGLRKPATQGRDEPDPRAVIDWPLKERR